MCTEYREDQYSVHRNVSVLVKRIPAASPAAGRRLFIAPGSLGPDWNKSTSTWVPPGMQDAAAAAADGNPLLGRSAGGEEGDIAAMMQARGSYSASGGRGGRSGPFQQTFNTRTLTPSSRPPSGYICHRCKQGGHFINFCPTNGDQAYDQARRGATTREDREREREREKERVNNSLSYGERDYSAGGGRHVPVAAMDAKPSQWLKPVEDPKALQAELDGGVAQEKETVHRAQRMFPSQFFAGNPAAQLPHSNKPLLAPEQTTYLPAYFDAASSAAAHAPAASAGTAATPAAPSVPAPPLRADLTCTLCKDYFLAASVLGCCFTTFCLECIQAHFKVRATSQPNAHMCMDTHSHTHTDVLKTKHKRTSHHDPCRSSDSLQPMPSTQNQRDSRPRPIQCSFSRERVAHCLNLCVVCLIFVFAFLCSPFRFIINHWRCVRRRPRARRAARPT